ncbi:MAG: CARDB domain-containing protein [Solirubrobacteraceae bacterium]|nr:MAG: hypothetical protein DLM63_01085 [Solirubrobacterales bacterium]
MVAARHSFATLAAGLAGLALLCAPAPALASVDHAGLIACARSLKPAAREASFVGQMRSLRPGDHLAMRFTVLQRQKDAPAFTALATLPWRVQPAHAPFWRWIEKVRDLPAAADYRARVTFLWRDDRGVVFARAQRLTPPCHQPDLRPNLHYAGLSAVTGAQANLTRYTVLVSNTGLSPAGAFDVALTIDGTALTPERAPALAAGVQEAVVFKGAPRCTPGGQLNVAIDPDNLIDESDKTDNTATVPCPLS